MSNRKCSLYLIAAGGLCLLLWASSWLWAFGVSIPITPSGSRIDVGVDSGYGYIVSFNSATIVRPFVYASEASWQRPSQGGPGPWQKAAPLMGFVLLFGIVGGSLFILTRNQVPNIGFHETSLTGRS